MLITYASHHSWYKYIGDDCFNHYGKSDRKKLRKSLKCAPVQGVNFEFSLLDQTFFEWFAPMYEKIIGNKKHAHLFDVMGVLRNSSEQSFGYRTLTVRDNGNIVGGCIFNDFGWYFSVAYRIYEQHWPVAKLPATPAFLGELQLDMYTKEQKRKMLTHGRDRNPYGLNSAIGLSIFKLAVGCRPRTALTHDVRHIETNDITEDCLILHYPTEGRKITEATLICTQDTLSRYQQLNTYSDRLTINTLIRPNL